MTFDIRPIWIVAALCSAGFGFLVLLLRRNFSDYLSRALTYWGIAYLCFGGLFFLCLGAGWAGPFLVYVAARTLGAIGFVFEYRAITALKRQRLSRAWLIAPPVLLFAALMWFTFVDRSAGLDLAASNFVYAVMTVRNAVSLMRPEDDRRPFVDVLAALSFWVLAAATAAAAVGFASADRFSREYDFNSPRLAYSTIAAIVVESVLFGLFLLAVSERLNHDFKFQASHDPLTGLYNRRTFEEIGHREVSGSGRTRQPLSLFLVDIDHFKRFNEEYGNAIGDFILRAAAEALHRSLRGEDYLCRWGADQFCALLPGTSREGAERAAERAFAAIEGLDIAVGGKAIHLQVNIGIVTRGDDGPEFPLLVKLADAALYQAKESGPDRFAFAG
jgi:diguanylate cyclase (GGDEF)-like protein